jgi:quercetin dioxygenase-like cupin family protein
VDNDPDLSAAVYALGALEGEERSAFLRRLEASEALQAELDYWRQRLAPLEPCTETAEPDASQWAAIARRLGFVTTGTRSARERTGIWVPYEPGVEIKYLRVDPVSAARTALLRVRPGSTCGSHAHDQTEHCVVLDGEVTLDDHRLTKGDLHIAPAGTVHSTIHSEGGCLLLLQWEPKAA